MSQEPGPAVRLIESVRARPTSLPTMRTFVAVITPRLETRTWYVKRCPLRITGGELPPLTSRFAHFVGVPPDPGCQLGHRPSWRCSSHVPSALMTAAPELVKAIFSP